MQTGGKTNIYKLLSKLSSIKWSIAIKGMLSGLISGLLVVIYRIGIEYGTETAIKIYAYLKLNPLMIIPWIILAASAGLMIAYLIKAEPMATGSGIPQVEGLLFYGFKIKWYSVLAVRFIAGITASFFGLSLGREGPSIQIGASGSHGLAKRISKNKMEQNYLITGGAAAGLSAAFNAPLSGIVFALEELHKSFSGLVLIAATTAALTADVVSKIFFGLKPVLSFAETPSIPVKYYIWLIPIGIVSGIVGAALNKALLWIQMLFRKAPGLLRPFIALLIALPCGIFLPSVLGGGQNLIEISENTRRGILIIVIYLAVKFIFTCISFGSGTPGGIFMPILAIGALTGSFVGLIATQFGVPGEYIPDFTVCAMAGALSGSVKAPLTSILLMAEMTGSLVHLLPVAICAFIAMFISDTMKTVPIYEALLERIAENDIGFKNDKLGGLIEVPVEMGSTAADKKVRDIEWPNGALLVNIHRGDREIVPNGNTIIFPGDYLIIMSSENTYRDLNIYIQELCHTR